MKVARRKKTYNLKGVECYIGESIETKVRRITDEKEPIKDGAPIIYQEKKDGVAPEYNIRTDRWQIAINAMEQVSNDRINKYLRIGEKPKKNENPTEAKEEPKSSQNNNKENAASA